VRVEYKVPGGKLVAAETTVESGLIKKVKISGDFFMYPEAAIIDLEEAITGTRVGDLESTIINFFDSHPTQLIGLGPSDFVHVVRLSLASAP
jgi:lipoate-protein ligase A